MALCTPQVLESYFAKYGWFIEPKDNGIWITGWQGQTKAFPMTVSLSETWLLLEISPFVAIDLNWLQWPEIMEMLLKINHESQMIKLSICDSGDLVLSLELFASDLKYHEFSDGLSVLGYYADRIFDDLIELMKSLGVHNSPQSYHLA